MINIPAGSKVDLNIGRPKQAMEHAQKTGFTGRMEFTFNLKTVHLFWRNGKPVGAVMLPKFGIDVVYGRDVIDSMPELIKTVLMIDFYNYNEADLLDVMTSDPEAGFAEQVIDIDDLPKFLISADDKSLKLLKMILFSKGEPSIDIMRVAFTMPPLADYSKEEFDSAFSTLLKGRVISTDGVGAQMPKYLRLILKNEIVNDIIERGALKEVLKGDDLFIKEFFQLLRKSEGSVSYNTLKNKYSESKDKYRLFETGDMLLESGVLIEGVDNKGDTLYVIPLEILENLEKIKEDKVDVKLSREELKKQLMEKFKMREPDRGQIKDIVNKFYED